MTLCDVDDVARAILELTGPIEAMKLEKLVYYTQAWHVAIEGEALFSDPIEAWRDGPVVDHLYQQHRRARNVHAWPSGDATKLPAKAHKIVEVVCGVYGDLSGDDLSELTHSEGPWLAARRGYSPEARSRQPIPLDAMKRYYRARKFAGRRPSDLAVGGLHYGRVYAISNEELRSTFDQIKREIKADSHRGDGRDGRASASVDFEAVSASEPSRSRPTR